MKIIKYTEKVSTKYKIENLTKDKNYGYFDIETTGLSRHRDSIYLIGLSVPLSTDIYEITLLFNDDGISESQLLIEFLKYIKTYNLDILIEFNGDSFDIPFVKERCKINKIPDFISNIATIDIYRSVKCLKKPLKFSSLKQKSIEQFLGINREDSSSGGELIQVYLSYLATKSPDLLESLLLHNHDDVLGLIKVCDIFSYIDIFKGNFIVNDFKRDEDIFIFKCHLNNPLNHKLWLSAKDASIQAYNEDMSVYIKTLKGELKYFFENYKDYFYLPDEDEAIHKSIAQFVDKNHRVKATKNNCYTKKSGYFLPVFSDCDLNTFKTECNSKIKYIDGDTLSDLPNINEYVSDVICNILS